MTHFTSVCIFCLFFPTICSSLAFSLFFSFLSVSAEPSRPHGGHDGHRVESEPSDDEMLSLSHQRSTAGTAPPKPDPPSAKPEPPEEVDLLGLDGGDISCPRPSSQPATSAATTTDLLGDLFGGPPQPTSGASSAQSTPHKVAPNAASPCPSPAPPGTPHYKLSVIVCIFTMPDNCCNDHNPNNGMRLNNPVCSPQRLIFLGRGPCPSLRT